MDDEAGVELSIIVPVYNGEALLAPAVEALMAWITARRVAAEIVVVNDGSKDGTDTVLAELVAASPRVLAVSYEKNRGKGYAVKQGFARARGNLVLFTDADLSYGTEVIGAFLAAARGAGPDVHFWYGARNLAGSRAHGYSRMRGAGHRFFSLYARTILVPDVFDTQCGIKMLDRTFAALAARMLTIDRFAFDIELFTIARANRFRVEPVSVAMSRQGASSLRLVRDAARMAFDIARIKLNDLRGAYAPVTESYKACTARSSRTAA